MSNIYSQIQKKEPIAGTFNSEDLLKRPSTVSRMYKEHALTHISLGETSKVISNIKDNILKNSTCGTGAIFGPFGYGKTSTAIHIWNELEKDNFLAIPPFKWHSIEEFIEAVFGYIKYKMSITNPTIEKELDLTYKNSYSEKNISKYAEKHDIPVEKVTRMYEDGDLNLEYSYKDLLDFCSLSSEMSIKAGFRGLVIFTDELQETLEKYKSHDAFFSDLFGICNDMLNRSGKWTIIWSIVEQTESYLRTERPDIIDRMMDRKIFQRLTEIYNSEFPLSLWKRYADHFNFKDKIYQVISEDALKSIGQISFRKDLGRGPRTVIRTLSVAISEYIKKEKTYDCFDLIDSFLNGQIEFIEPRFNEALSKALNNSTIKGNKNYESIIKLAAAFPEGVPEIYWENYGLKESFDEIINQIAGDILYSKANGYTLKGLMEQVESKEPVFVGRLKTKLQKYAPTNNKILADLQPLYLKALFKDVLSDWKDWDKNQKWDGYLIKGSIDGFPDKTIALVCENSWDEKKKYDVFEKKPDIIFVFKLDQIEVPLKVEVEENFKVLYFTIPLKRKPNMSGIQPQVIPYINDRYSADITTAALLIFILKTMFFEVENNTIPKAESDSSAYINFIKIVRNNLWLALYGSEISLPQGLVIHEKSDGFWKSLITKILPKRYPEYITLDKAKGDWEKIVTNYVSRFLKDSDFSTKQIRGKASITQKKDWWKNHFEISLSGLKARFDSLEKMKLIKYSEISLDTYEVYLTMHPLEEDFLNKLEKSSSKTKIENQLCKKIDKKELFEFSTAQGYTMNEFARIIELMNARKFLKPEKDYFIQILDSFDDKKQLASKNIEDFEKLLEDLNNYNNIEFLSNISTEKVKIKELKKLLDIISESDEIDEINKKLKLITNHVENLMFSEKTYYVKKFNDAQNKIKEFSENLNRLKTKLNDDFTDSKGWSDILNYKKKKNSEDIELFLQELLKNYTEIKKANDSVKLKEYVTPELLTKLLSFEKDVKREEDELLERLNLTKAKIEPMLKWKELISLFQKVEKLTSALAKQKVYTFSEELEKMNANIRTYLINNKDGAFIESPNKYTIELENLEKHCREASGEFRKAFETNKNILDTFLNNMEIENKLRTNFDSENPTISNQSILEEFFEASIKWIEKKEQFISSVRAEAIYALNKINPIELEEIENKLVTLQDILLSIKNIVVKTPEIIKNKNKIKDFLLDFKSLNGEILSEKRTWLKPNIDISQETKVFLKRLEKLSSNNRNNLDTRELIIEEIKQSNSEESVFAQIIELFSKNHIDLKITLRS